MLAERNEMSAAQSHIEQLGEESSVWFTLTPLLKRLEARGLVDRTRDPQDERSVRVTLTSEGERMKARAKGIPEAVGEVIDLPEDEFEATRLALRRLTANVLAGQARPPGAVEEETTTPPSFWTPMETGSMPVTFQPSGGVGRWLARPLVPKSLSTAPPLSRRKTSMVVVDRPPASSAPSARTARWSTCPVAKVVPPLAPKVVSTVPVALSR